VLTADNIGRRGSFVAEDRIVSEDESTQKKLSVARALFFLANVLITTAAEAADGGPQDWLDQMGQGADATISPFPDQTDAHQISFPPSAAEYGHAAKHFFRYLIDSSEADARSQQAIAAEFERLASLRSQAEFAGGLDALVQRNSELNASETPRGLFQVLPEFLTEYASYGGARYLHQLPDPENRNGDTGEITAEAWIEDVFLDCVVLDVSPGMIDFSDIILESLAGECVKISWTGFTRPVALQLFAEGAGRGYGNLHLGEALHRDAIGDLSCYGHTHRLANRIALPMNQKCMLRRGAQVIGGEEIATWTSGFNLLGSGSTHLIVSNVAKDAAETRPVEFRLVAGALSATKVSGTHIEPREITALGAEIGRGMTLMDSRVHTMVGGPDRILFDNGSIAGTGVETGFLENMPGGQSGAGGVFTFVRGGDYWIGLMGDRSGAQDIENVGFIMKEPGRLDTTANMPQGLSQPMGMGGLPSFGGLGGGAFQPPIVAGGMMEFPGTVECGYQPAVKVTPMERSRYTLRFRMSADLFDPMKMMTAGGSASGCSALRHMHVEFADFEVSLPFGLFYESDVEISRGSPSGQEAYDKIDFFDGPNFGGILSSRSIFGAVMDWQASEDEPSEELETQTVLAQTLSFTARSPFEPKTILAQTLQFTGQGPFEPRTVRARTLKFFGRGPFEPRTVHARTLSFTGEGPFEPRMVYARTLKFEGQGEFEAETVLAQSLEFNGTAAVEPRPIATQTQETSSAAAFEEIFEPTLEPLAPTVDAQVTYLKRLISDQGLTEDVEQMLLEDFANMSDETRAYLIKRYRRGYE